MDAPYFELEEMRSGEIIRLSDFAGKPVMITFWASWCPDCMRDLPMKEQFYQHADLNKLGFITINVTGRERSQEAGKAFTTKHQLPFPVLKDNGRTTYDMYNCTGVPTTVLLDKEHRIFKVFDDQSSFVDVVGALPQIML
ncbi:TlpA disulfide reductase family protein [Alkalihalobacillus macyae]|uniref:TlpA family protein disulfide reductase n=1 Tax=Guptibacillus hwajinpoensis TaxID=208199 RepID=UPI00273B410E|nr:TlpA disulfide reductase family protein [Alkalihalobacillus macyae]MDP4552446.1 TlpA disulfide reductase family protein [Alkalihalobacillus macyae]